MKLPYLLFRRTAFDRWVAEVGQVFAFANTVAGACKNLEALISEKDARLTKLQEELVEARTKQLAAEKGQGIARAYYDTLRLQYNQLQHERAALLHHALPSITVKVPSIEKEGHVIPTGIDFEDMGDDLAALHGLGDEIPLGESKVVGIPRTPPHARLSEIPIDPSLTPLGQEGDN